jgi:peptidoglycan hydrolase-like protein with peptidoglycan-binding domain
MREKPRAKEREPPAPQVVDDDPEPGDARQLAQQGNRLVGLQVMDDQRDVGDVERPVGVGERPPVADVELQPIDGREVRVGEHRCSEDRRLAVEPHHVEAPPVASPRTDQGHGDVGAACSDVEQRQFGAPVGQQVEPPRGQGDPAQVPIHPAQVAQVPHERRSVVERAVEPFLGAGQTLHPRAGYRSMRADRRRQEAVATLTTMCRRRRRDHLLVSLALAGLLVGATVASVTALSVQYPNQSRGDRGSNVRALQGLLRQRGAIIPVDGNFGATTVAAVKAFQTSHGLPADGVVGTTTWTALRVQMAPGASGEAVKALQRELNEKRRVGLVVDSVYGSTTTAAVRAFQHHAGLAVTGIASLTTWRALVSHLETPTWSRWLCDYSVGNGPANWGTGAAIGGIEAAGLAMRAEGHGRIAIGDISLEHGGDIAGHVFHEQGLEIDVRPMRRAENQCRWPVNWRSTAYDRAATRDLIKAVRASAPGHIKLIWFNDPVLIREGLVRWHVGHDDHLHIRYCERAHPVPAYVC